MHTVYYDDVGALLFPQPRRQVFQALFVQQDDTCAHFFHAHALPCLLQRERKTLLQRVVCHTAKAGQVFAKLHHKRGLSATAAAVYQPFAAKLWPPEAGEKRTVEVGHVEFCLQNILVTYRPCHFVITVLCPLWQYRQPAGCTSSRISCLLRLPCQVPLSAM